MYFADFDFDCKSHLGGFCGWSAVLKSKSFDGGKIGDSNCFLGMLLPKLIQLWLKLKRLPLCIEHYCGTVTKSTPGK